MWVIKEQSDYRYRNGDYQGLGQGGNGELVFIECGVWVWKDEKVLGMGGGHGCIAVWKHKILCLMNLMNLTLKKGEFYICICIYIYIYPNKKGYCDNHLIF